MIIHHRQRRQQAEKQVIDLALEPGAGLARAEDDMMNNGTIVALLEWVLGEREVSEGGDLNSIGERIK